MIMHFSYKRIRGLNQRISFCINDTLRLIYFELRIHLKRSLKVNTLLDASYDGF